MLVFYCKRIILVVQDRGWDLKLAILTTSLPATTPKAVAVDVVFALVVWVIVLTVVCWRNSKHNNRRRRQVKCCYCQRRHVKSTCVERLPTRERIQRNEVCRISRILDGRRRELVICIFCSRSHVGRYLQVSFMWAFPRSTFSKREGWAHGTFAPLPRHSKFSVNNAATSLGHQWCAHTR